MIRLLLAALVCLPSAQASARSVERPNIVFILTDDQRFDALHSAGNDFIRTPHLDSLAERGTLFRNAFVTLSICSPSRAACLTGRYGSANGVTTVGRSPLNPAERTFAHYLKDAGYRTGVVGKWHLGTTPRECGFDFATICFSNGTWYGRQFDRDGQKFKAEGFVDDFVADEAIGFIKGGTAEARPFVLWMCTQVPHMDHRFQWPAKQDFLDRYEAPQMPLAGSWNDDLAGKPAYLKTSRNRTQALRYGYDKAETIRRHTRDYYAAVEQMDASVGKLLQALDEMRLTEKTWILFMGDNGWLLGEHGFTSKVLPYEESIRVPMIVAGPGTTAREDRRLVLNIDLAATIVELVGLSVPEHFHGRSLLPLVRAQGVPDWRRDFLYEAPSPQLGSRPLWAVRTDRWKYVETSIGDPPADAFRELYDLENDPGEMRNLATHEDHATTVEELAARLAALRRQIDAASATAPAKGSRKDD